MIVREDRDRKQAEEASILAERMSIPQLSDRELEVLNLMARGKNNQEISAELSISESTVKFHTKNIMSKLGASDRSQRDHHGSQTRCNHNLSVDFNQTSHLLEQPHLSKRQVAIT